MRGRRTDESHEHGDDTNSSGDKINSFSKKSDGIIWKGFMWLGFLSSGEE